ncbi:hypothetical protein AB6A23_00280 [Paenibacillus tarimensis]
MQFQQLIDLCEDENMDERVLSENIQLIGTDQYKINNFVAISIEEIAGYYDASVDSKIIDSSGAEIGYLCYQRKAEFITELTDVQLVAYLRDITIVEYNSGLINISKNYVVIHADKLDEYQTVYMKTAPVWGNFSHAINTNAATKRTIDSIKASKIKLPTEYHEESIMRAIQQPYGFERFLKTYHMLELLFDYDFISEIRSLPDELKGLNSLLKEFNKREELDRLRKVITKRQSNLDFAELTALLNKVIHYRDLAIEIFFEYGKETNPINSTEMKSSLDRFSDLLAKPEPFKYEDLRNVITHINNMEKYHKFLIDISTYWIYRVRCSIAHYKIGEYIMKYEDEKFVVDFMEPILKLIVTDCFVDTTI